MAERKSLSRKLGVLSCLRLTAIFCVHLLLGEAHFHNLLSLVSRKGGIQLITSDKDNDDIDDQQEELTAVVTGTRCYDT